MKTIKLSEYAKINSVTYRTAWNRFISGKIKGAFQDDLGNILIKEENTNNKDKVLIYSRVSSSQNKSNLKSQTDRLINYCSASGIIIDEIYEEIGSGLNDNRKKLLKLLTDDKIKLIVVEHKDRLTRFGFNYIKTILKNNGTEILVINNAKTDEEDIIQDLVSIITSFCARIYGKRRTKRITEKITNELRQC